MDDGPSFDADRRADSLPSRETHYRTPQRTDAHASDHLSDDDTPDHFEFSMGFIAGQRSYDRLAFALGNLPAGALEGAPFDRVEVFGLRYDLRLVVSHVRMTVGVDLPFTSYSEDDARRMLPEGLRRVNTLRAYDLRFGIGGEYAFGPVAPFVDLTGSVHWASTELLLDAAATELDAVGFGFTARGGVRLQVRRWFFASVSGEVGIVGPVRWGVDLSVGFALGD